MAYESSYDATLADALGAGRPVTRPLQLRRRRGLPLDERPRSDRAFGTGKGTLHRVIAAIFGNKNARKIEGVELAEPYTARLVDAQVLMIEEARHGERLEVFEKTKELLTAEFYYAHDKHVRRFRGRTARGMFLASNDAAPMVLPRGDRRWFVCSTPETPETEEEKKANRTFFKRLHALKTSTWADNLERLSPKKVVKAMHDLGAREVNMDGDDHLEVVVAGKALHRWAIRNVARWRATTREELKAEATRPVTEQNVADFNETRLKRMME